MKIQLLDAGSCVHPQHVVLRNRSLRPMRFHSMFSLMIHPKEGVILFDTGYSEKFLDITRKFPGRIYTLTTPVRFSREESAVQKLKRMGISSTDVRHIIISHFHADHYGAIGDFPKAKYWFHHSAWESIRHKNRWRAVFSGFLPELIPEDFLERSVPLHAKDQVALPPEFAPFQRGVDMFGDETITLVDLHGHAAGQLGCFVQSELGTPVFLIADASWTTQSYQDIIVPHPITKILFSDYDIYQQTLHDIKDFAAKRPDYLIIPSHCPHIHHDHCNKGEL